MKPMTTPPKSRNAYHRTRWLPRGRGAGDLGRWVVWATLAVTLVLPTVGIAAGTDEEIELVQTWTGDYDAMVERRQVRILVVPNKMFYFLDRGHPRGVNVDMFREFEKFINKRAKTGVRAIEVIFVPVARDQLMPGLTQGRGDIAAANLTVTDERARMVDFSDPMLTSVKEIVALKEKYGASVDNDIFWASVVVEF